MVSLGFCIGCIIIYVVVIGTIGCWLRLKGNAVLINPIIGSKKNLQNYYAIVTGSNQGIGYEVAKYLVNHGCSVIMACRSNERGKAAEQSINAQVQSNAVYI